MNFGNCGSKPGLSRTTKIAQNSIYHDAQHASAMKLYLLPAASGIVD
jgi:hypothetical protein